MMMLKKIVIRPGARTATRPVSCREELWDPEAREVSRERQRRETRRITEQAMDEIRMKEERTRIT